MKLKDDSVCRSTLVAIIATTFYGMATTIAEEGYRASYYKDGEIHVNVLGTPEGEPLTKGHWDFKPSWSKTDDRLVFFRRLVNSKDVSKWKTAMCIINVDGTGFISSRMELTRISIRRGLETEPIHQSGIASIRRRTATR